MPRVVYFALISLSLVATSGRAQSVGMSGTVRDNAGAPVAGADVSVKGRGITFTTNDQGAFHFSDLAAGTYTLTARRLGFRPDSISVTVAGAAVNGVTISLAPLAANLSPVVVKTTRVEYKGRLAGYYERLARRSNGQFITRADIDDQNPRTLSQLLQRAPGMSAFRGRGGLSGVRMRGRNCWPLVWLDGTQMPSGEFDLDGISPNTLQGIELYLGSTSAPVRYTGGRDFSGCGTILLWSRGPDTDPVVKQKSLWSLEALVASMSVYTADQVDTSAALDASRSFNVEYPASLFAQKMSGTVIAEFVVSADGKVEDDTFGVVSSPDRLFSESVRRALSSAVYRPAIKGGRAVRQLVHQPFTFSLGAKATSTAVSGKSQ